MQPADEGPGGSKEPLRKASAACTLCQLRKRRCDGQQPCGYCQTKGAADECTFTTPLKRGPKKGAVYKKRRPRVPPPPPPPAQVDAEVIAAAEAIVQEPFTTPPPAPSAPLPFLPQAPPAAETPLADLSYPLLQHLLQVHHQYIESLTGIPLFTSSRAPETTSRALLYAIAGSAAGFSTHPLVGASTVDGGQDWIARAREELLHAGEEERFSVTGVQTLITLASDAMVRGKGRQARLDTASALSIALSLDFDAPSTTNDDEAHQALFTIYALELHLSLGSPTSLALTHTEASILSLPLPSTSSLGLPITINLTSTSLPTSLPSLLPHTLRSLHLLRRAHSLSSLPPSARKDDWDPSSEFAEICLELSDWGDLPVGGMFNSTVLASLAAAEEDEGDDGEGGVTGYMTMHLAHHLAYLLLFRAYLPLPGEGGGAGGAFGAEGEGAEDEQLFKESCHAKALTHAVCLGRVLVACSKYTFGITPLGALASFTAASALLFSVTPSSVGAQALQAFLSYLSAGREWMACFSPLYDTLHQLVQVHSSGIPALPDTPRHPFFARYATWGIKEPSFGAAPSSSSSSTSASMFIPSTTASDLPPLPQINTPPRVPSPTPFSFALPTPTPAAFDFALDFSLGGGASQSSSPFNLSVDPGGGAGGGAVDPWFGATLPTSMYQVDDLTADDFDVFAFLASPPGQLWNQH